MQRIFQLFTRVDVKATLTSLRPTARVARGATYLFVQGFATAVISLVYFIVLAHILPKEELGVYALLSFIVTLPQVFGTLAFPSAAVKYIAQYLGEDNKEKAKSVIARVLQICVLSSVVALIVLVVQAELLSTLIFGNANYAQLLQIVGLSSVFMILNIAVTSFLQGLQRMREVAAIGLTYTLIQNGVSILLLYMGWGLYAVVIGWFLGLFIATVSGLVLTAKFLGIFGKPHPTKPLFRFSLPLYVSGGLGFFVSWVDQLILVSYMSLIEGSERAQLLLGIYYVAVRASVVPALFSSSLITALLPQLSELYAQQGSDSLKSSFTVSGRYAVLIGFPIIVGLATLAYPTIILFTGWSQWDASLAASSLVIMSLAALIGTVGVAVGPILMTLERTAVVSVTSVVSMIASVFLSYLALAYFNLGMIGTAWARTIAAVIGVLLSLYALKRYIPLYFDKEALWKASAASGLLVFAILAVDLMRKLVTPDSYQFLVIRLHQLPIYVLVGGLAYFIAFVALRGIKKMDVELIQEYLPKSLKPLASWLERFAV